MRKIVLFGVVLLIVFVLAGCRPELQAVSFMVFGDPAEFAAYQALVDAFEASQDEVDVTLSHIPSQGDYRTKLATDFAAGAPPYVSLLSFRRAGAFNATNQLEPLGPYLAKSDVIAA